MESRLLARLAERAFDTGQTSRDQKNGLSIHPQPPSLFLTMPQVRRWQGQAPRASLLHPLWEPVMNGKPSEAAFIASCLLGPGVVSAT